MPSTATITGVKGPAAAVTATVFTGIIGLSLDTDNEILTLFFNGGRPPVIINVAAQTTWTLTVSGNVYTLTVA